MFPRAHTTDPKHFAHQKLPMNNPRCGSVDSSSFFSSPALLSIEATDVPHLVRSKRGQSVLSLAAVVVEVSYFSALTSFISTLLTYIGCWGCYVTSTRTNSHTLPKPFLERAQLINGYSVNMWSLRDRVFLRF